MIDVEAYMAEWSAHRAGERARIRASFERRAEESEQRWQERSALLERQHRRDVTHIAYLLEGTSSPEVLHFWFRHDTWTVNEALILLCNFRPENVKFGENGKLIEEDKPIRRLDGLKLFDELTETVAGSMDMYRMRRMFEEDYAYLLKFWNSGSHSEHRYPPVYFIRWAISKGYIITWLNWANENGYSLGAEQSTNQLIEQEEDRPLGTRERNNLYSIIAGLCNAAGYDYTRWAKTAALVVGDTQRQGLSVSESTIEGVLKKVAAHAGRQSN